MLISVVNRAFFLLCRVNSIVLRMDKTRWSAMGLSMVRSDCDRVKYGKSFINFGHNGGEFRLS